MAKPLRIGFDARIAYYSQGGIAQYSLQLLDALARLDAEDEFVVFLSRKERGPLVEGPNFRSHRLWTPCHHPWEQWALPLELSLAKLDLLHSPDFIPPLRRRCPSVITVHDLAFLLYPHFLTPEAARYYGQIDRAVASAEHIIAVSASTKADLVRLLGAPEEKIAVIHEAAHPLFRLLGEGDSGIERAKARYGIREDYLLFVSTIEPRKNLPGLLRAYDRLCREYRLPLELVVAGGRGGFFQGVEEVLEKEVPEGRVVFCGPVEREELLYLYNGAKALAYPSFYEGFGLPPLEAMACGTPVVAANTSSIPEVVGEAAVLVPPEDVEGLAAALWRVVSDEALRKDLRRRGLERAKLFSWEAAARKTREVYRRVAGQP